MANIIISEASGKFKELYGNIQVPLASFIEEQAKKDKQNCIALSIFSERTSNGFGESYGGLTAADEMENVGEGALHPLNSFEQRGTKVIENETFKSKILITREIVDDAHGDMKKIIQRTGAIKLTSSYYRTVDSFANGLLVSALSNSATYTRGSKSYSTKSFDGKIVFATDHKSGKNAICNAFKDGFSADVLGKLSTAQQNFKGEKGEDLGITPDTIVIPNDYTLKKAVFAAIGSDKDPGTANNGFNYLFGQWRVIVDNGLNALIPSTGNVPFFLLDSKFNDTFDGNIFQNRTDLEITSKEAEGNNNAWEAYTRFSCGFVDYRHMIAGGVSWGTAL